MATKPHKPAATAQPAPPPQPAAVVGSNTYLVGNTPILRDGVMHNPGDVIELTPAQALRLGLEPFEVIDPNFPPLP